MSDVQQQKIQTRPGPIDWSKYERTYNNAIDLVAQCIGYHRKTMKPLKAVVLKPASFELFRAGLRILMAKHGQHMDEHAELQWDGVKIKRGNAMQFDSIICEYHSMHSN